MPTSMLTIPQDRRREQMSRGRGIHQSLDEYKETHLSSVQTIIDIAIKTKPKNLQAKTSIFQASDSPPALLLYHLYSPILSTTHTSPHPHPPPTIQNALRPCRPPIRRRRPPPRRPRPSPAPPSPHPPPHHDLHPSRQTLRLRLVRRAHHVVPEKRGPLRLRRGKRRLPPHRDPVRRAAGRRRRRLAARRPGRRLAED